ncbi:phosphodiester glycosidase family protein [Floricoccus penangensis]|uniref:phosphodiester glycosidase family protein n=1 Tax=Floricoccus penangensis TaxID=1859475 RepID=UPI002041887A|nr:phosphodiester glycosidase family protein [Floricoccus penangensis]URZ87267.1 phosphodiester glycosidase family protein [Floricoccus penangensis]
MKNKSKILLMFSMTLLFSISLSVSAQDNTSDTYLYTNSLIKSNNLDYKVVEGKTSNGSKTWNTLMHHVKIGVGYANDELTNNFHEENASDFAKRHKLPVVSNTTTGIHENGERIVNGKVVLDSVVKENAKPVTDYLAIGTDKKTLSSVSSYEHLYDNQFSNTTTSFFPLVKNGKALITPKEYGYLSRHPRQIIYQLKDKSVGILTIAGRVDGNLGATPPEMVEEVMKIPNIDFAYNMDGGGSSSQIIKGEMINPPFDVNTKKERPREDFLYFYPETQPDPLDGITKVRTKLTNYKRVTLNFVEDSSGKLVNSYQMTGYTDEGNKKIDISKLNSKYQLLNNKENLTIDFSSNDISSDTVKTIKVKETSNEEIKISSTSSHMSSSTAFSMQSSTFSSVSTNSEPQIVQSTTNLSTSKDVTIISSLESVPQSKSESSSTSSQMSSSAAFSVQPTTSSTDINKSTMETLNTSSDLANNPIFESSESDVSKSTTENKSDSSIITTSESNTSSSMELSITESRKYAKNEISSSSTFKPFSKDLPLHNQMDLLINP